MAKRKTRKLTKKILSVRDRTSKQIDKTHKEDLKRIESAMLRCLSTHQEILSKGCFYRLKDDNVDGVYELINIITGKELFYVFKHVVTGAETSYRERDFSGFDKLYPLSEAEVEIYRSNYFRITISRKTNCDEISSFFELEE